MCFSAAEAIATVANPVGAVANAATYLKAKASINAGNAQADAARSQAAIDDENAKLAEEQALQSERNAEFEAGKIREAGARLTSRQRLAAVGQNVDPSTGSAAEAIVGSAEVTQEQVGIARLTGAWEAYGYRSQGLQFSQIAAARRRAADHYQEAGYINAAAGVASDVTSFVTQWWKPWSKGGR